MELIKNKLVYYDLLLDRISNYEESTDAIVPDAYPDILRIVCAMGDAVLKDQSPQNDRLLVSGTVRTCVLYQPEDAGALRRLEVPISFAHIEECKGISADTTCFVQCRAAGVEAHAVNSRKISITARLCFSVSAYGKREMEWTRDVQSDEYPLEILQESREICLPETVICKEFTVLEDPEEPDCEGAQIVGKQCALELEEYRTMHGKVVLKGVAQLACTMLRKDADEVFVVSKNMPFTQILDCEGMEEGKDLRIRFAVSNTDVELREAGMLSVGIHAEAQLCALQKQTLQTIRDLYQTRYQLHVDAKPVFLRSMIAARPLHIETMEEVPLTIACRRVVDLRAVCYAMKQEAPDGLRLSIQAEMLLMDTDAQLHQVFRSFTVTAHDESATQKLLSGDVKVQCVAEIGGERMLRVRIFAEGALLFAEQLAASNVTGVEIGAPREQELGDTAVVVRYVNTPENLWDIAKSYHTTVRAIRSANAMQQEVERIQDQMLLIPICER